MRRGLKSTPRYRTSRTRSPSSLTNFQSGSTLFVDRPTNRDWPVYWFGIKWKCRRFMKPAVTVRFFIRPIFGLLSKTRTRLTKTFLLFMLMVPCFSGLWLLFLRSQVSPAFVTFWLTSGRPVPLVRSLIIADSSQLFRFSLPSAARRNTTPKRLTTRPTRFPIGFMKLWLIMIMMTCAQRRRVRFRLLLVVPWGLPQTVLLFLV